MLDSPDLARRRRDWRISLIGVALASSLVTFLVTWSITSSRPVAVTFVNPSDTSQATASPTASVTTSANAQTSGGVALTEAQLIAAVKNVGGTIYWAGSMSGATYTFNHLASGQNFIRYLPNGNGLADTAQNYRVIATYQDAKAYETMQTAGKLATGVSATNSDGGLIYYAKATPTHVYLAYKNLPYQIEIFDPVAGAALKLAQTPGLIATIS